MHNCTKNRIERHDYTKNRIQRHDYAKKTRIQRLELLAQTCIKCQLSVNSVLQYLDRASVPDPYSIYTHTVL